MSTVSHFSEFIETDGENLFFSFYRIYTAEEVRFFVSVTKNHKPLVFDMKKDESGEWKVNDSAPEWVKFVQSRLSEAIKKNIQLIR